MITHVSRIAPDACRAAPLPVAHHERLPTAKLVERTIAWRDQIVPCAHDGHSKEYLDWLALPRNCQRPAECFLVSLSRRDPNIEDAGSSFQLSTDATQLMDQSKVEASTKGTPEEITAVAANDQEPSFTIEDAVDFKEAISRQAAARAARFANRPRRTDDELRQAIREFERQERLLRLRPFKLALKVFIGALIFAGIMFYMLGADLRLPFPSASAPLDARR